MCVARGVLASFQISMMTYFTTNRVTTLVCLSDIHDETGHTQGHTQSCDTPNFALSSFGIVTVA